MAPPESSPAFARDATAPSAAGQPLSPMLWCRPVAGTWSVPVSVHQPAPERTQATWLDSTPDLSCANSTQAHCVDVEHQPTDLAVKSQRVTRRAATCIGRVQG
jgi:hypothetical protein